MAAALALLAALSPGLCLAQAARYACTLKGPPPGADTLRLDFTFDRLGNAFIVGNAGIAPVSVHRGTRGLTFLEALPTGAVQSTTIAEDGSAVHSRHTMTPAGLLPSQLVGRCE